MKKLLLAAFLVFASMAHGAMWKWQENASNFIEIADFGQSGKLELCRGAGTSWYWGAANGVTFLPQNKMTEDADTLSVRKTAGGDCYWKLPLKFDKPISSFTLTTPRFTGANLDTGNISISYHLPGEPTTNEIWHYDKGSAGYVKDGSIGPVKLGEIKFDKPISELSLGFYLKSYVRDMEFSPGAGVFEYQTATLPRDQMIRLKLFPDAARLANTYYESETIRGLLSIGPNQEKILPNVFLYDIGRQKKAGNCTLTPVREKYVVDMPEDLQPGIYDIRCVVPGDIDRSIMIGKIAVILPPRKLTWAQSKESMFGICYMLVDGRYRDSADINGPMIGKMLGVHRSRSGSATWITVCNEGRGKYNWPDYEKMFEDISMKYGILMKCSLAWSPQWSVDMSRVEKDHWFGHYPCQVKYLKDYAEFCKLQVEKTRGFLEQDYEIWNEPNCMPLGSFKGTFAEFARICKTAADAVNSANPKAQMILGTTGDADVNFIVELFKSGLARKYDIVDIHPYRHNNQGPEDGLLCDINRLKIAIKKYGNNQKIIFSEIGWPTSTESSKYFQPVTPFQQACFFSRTLLISKAAGIDHVSFHMMADMGNIPKDAEFNFGIVDIKGQPKPSLVALSTTHRQLERAKFLGVMKTPSQFVHSWAWKNPWEEGTMVTVWADKAAMKDKSQDNRWVTLPAEPVKIVDLWSGTPVKSRVRKVDNKWQVLADEDPLFIYVNEKVDNLAPLPDVLRPLHKLRLIFSFLFNHNGISTDQPNRHFNINQEQNRADFS